MQSHFGALCTHCVHREGYSVFVYRDLERKAVSHELHLTTPKAFNLPGDQHQGSGVHASQPEHGVLRDAGHGLLASPTKTPTICRFVAKSSI